MAVYAPTPTCLPKDGDERFEEIFKRHHAPLLAYCRHMLGNREEAEDALQQAFIRAHRALRGGSGPRELRPWLYAIARNCYLSAIAARRPIAELEDHQAALAGLSEEVHAREELRELVADIGRLPEAQRSALLLAELEDLDHRAIATIVGCPVSKVKALVFQARTTLIAQRDARDASCREIREQLAVARGGELRRGPLRRHLSLCASCRDFQGAVAAQRQSLALVLPVLPSAGLALRILGATHAGAGGASALGGGASGAGGGLTTGGGGITASVTSGNGAVVAASGVHAPVTLLAHTDRQGFAPVAQATTDASGNYAFPAQAPVNSTFYEAQGAGRTSAVLYEGVKDVLTAQVSQTTIEAGQTLTFSGALAPDHTGHVVYLERQNASGTGFHVVQVATVNPGSVYSIAHTVYVPGTKVFRVMIPGGPENEGAASQPFVINVTPAPASALEEGPESASLPAEGEA
jgi:RNA polymerase sigma factor (sigma-70 family)